MCQDNFVFQYLWSLLVAQSFWMDRNPLRGRSGRTNSTCECARPGLFLGSKEHRRPPAVRARCGSRRQGTRLTPRMGCPPSGVSVPLPIPTIRQNCARYTKATGLYYPTRSVSTCYLNIYQQARVDIVDNLTVPVETFVDKLFAMSMAAAPLSIPLLLTRCTSFTASVNTEGDHAAGRLR